MKRLLTALSLLMLVVIVCATTVLSGVITISGQVKGSDGVCLEYAAVREVDAQGRIINQVCTDANGLFSMQVRSNKNMLEVSAEGYHSAKVEIADRKMFRITLERKAADQPQEMSSRLRKTMLSDRLLCGHHNGQTIPTLVWIDQYNDTIVELIVPVQATNMVDVYPQGRMIRFMGLGNKEMEMAASLEETFPQAGTPEEKEASFWQRMRNANFDDDSITREQKNTICYFYPRFCFTITQLQHLADSADSLLYVAADNSAGNNRWLLYPTKDFSRELQKYLKKLTK